MKMDREMFDDRDYPTQWALNPSMYQNMNNDQVDWAALAQQWIKMKETVVPPAPPPPSLSDGDTEGGEAPMDMDTISDDVPPAPPAPNISGNDNWSAWSQWGQWNTSGPGGGFWEWSGVPPPGVQLGPDGKPMGIPGVVSVPPAPTITNRTGFNVPPPAPGYSYNSVTPSPGNFNSVPGYWDGNLATAPGSPTFKGIPRPRIPHMRDPLRDEKEKTPDEDTTMVIDAAKRRQLPAWIREGLEKMEREKHKAVERERQDMLRKQEMEARKLAEDEARAVLDPSKSKFDSESDKEVEEEQIIDETKESSPDIIIRQRKSRFRDADSPEARLINSESTSSGSITGVAVKRTREQILQDVMLKVRRSLTEILLEVTNEEISSVCREVWTRYRVKVPAGEPPVASYNNKVPLAQITRNLGLGIYGDSNSESEDDADSPTPDNNDNQDDSDLELKETLRRRQAAFKKTEEEIEARIAEEEENERNDDANHENSINNKTLDDKEVNNERETSETQSSGHTPRNEENIKSSSRSVDSESSSSSSSSSSTTTETNSSSSRNLKRRNDKRNDRRKRYRSRSSSHNRKTKRSRDRKRRSRSSTNSRSRRSRSRSRRRRVSRSRSRTRSRSRHRSRRSHSYGRISSCSSSVLRSRRTRSKSRDKEKKRSSRSRTRSRSRSRSRSRRREGKKSSHRYRD